MHRLRGPFGRGGLVSCGRGGFGLDRARCVYTRRPIMARAIWKGTLGFGLVSIGVELHSGEK
ncbi:MAG TPA: hypothetical protein VLA89_12570, partial [Gemmatimonadales bacterium]|nr:hypothetical protein [Gemmatimonadales bacterium]